MFLPTKGIGALCSIISILSLLSRCWLLHEDEALYFILMRPITALNRIGAHLVVGKLTGVVSMPDRRLPAFGFTSVCPTGRAVLRNLKLSMLCRSNILWTTHGGQVGANSPTCQRVCTKLDLNLVLRRTAAAVLAPLRSCPRKSILKPNCPYQTGHRSDSILHFWTSSSKIRLLDMYPIQASVCLHI